MFTGLVEELGRTQWLKRMPDSTELAIAAPKTAEASHHGDSISVNGCCLTVTSARRGILTFDLLAETVARTNLGDLRPDFPVNLETSLKAGEPLGGHFVQGHIDCTAEVRVLREVKPDLKLEVEIPEGFEQYVAFKGSVAINGVSLTVADIERDSMVIWIIPETRGRTNIGELRRGERVNVEFDILAKYVERSLHFARADDEGSSLDR